MTIYSSLPYQGTSRGQSVAVDNGMRLALREASGQAGGLTIDYVALDDSTRANPGTADEAKTRSNARRAAADPDTIAYLGEFNSGGTKVSLPILNRAGILQVSPSNTYNGLTVGGPGTFRGEPARYYPTGRRTYGRLLPNDAVQGSALATLMKDSGCRSAFLVTDTSLYGNGIVAHVRSAARRIHLPVTGQGSGNPFGPALRRTSARVRSPCLMYGGVTDNGAVLAFRFLARAHPRLRFFGSDGVTEEAFTNPRKGGISAAIGRRTLLTVASLGFRSFPPEGRAFAERFRTAYGFRGPVDPYASYGYETMNVVLDAINRAGARSADRAAVVDAFFGTRDRHGVIGTYSIQPNGDTTLRSYGVYGVSRGLPTYLRAIVAR